MNRLLTIAFLLLSFNVYSQIPGPETIELGEWSFSKDGTDWEKVSVPHSYNALDGHSAEYYRGKAHYLKEIDLGNRYKEKSAFLVFEGAAQKAEVIVNGQRVCLHKGGYTPFFVNLSGLSTGLNTIEVICDNTEDLTMIPVSSDFNKNGGLHYPVRLVFLNKIHAEPDTEFGLYRMHVSTPELSPRRAKVLVSTKIVNESSINKNISVKVTIRDGKGKIAVSKKQKISVEGHSSSYFSKEVTIGRPHLWNGLADPYLYSVELELFDGADLLDRTGTAFGIRSFSIDKDKGFCLNGRPYALRGVSMHQDMERRASALYREDIDRDFDFVRELGCNFLRLAHYPHNDYTFRKCDELGIIVQTEIPWVNVCGKDVEDEYFRNIHSQMREMVGSLYNHPSIVFWGMWNELDKWGNKPGIYQGDFNPQRIVKETEILYRLAKQLDPYRYTGLTDDSAFRRPGYTTLKGDFFSDNRYNGWYYKLGDFSGLTEDMKGIHEAMGITNLSEYGAGVNPYCHSWDSKVSNSLESPYDAKHFEAYGNRLHESHVQQILDMPFLNFTSLWILFDFPVANRKEGYLDSSDGVNFVENPERMYMNDKGLVTRDRKLKKDAFFLYRSLWNKSEETVYITERRLERMPEGTEYYLKVYSNSPELELFINGQSKGILKSSGERSGVIWTFGPLVMGSGAEEIKVVSPSGKYDKIVRKPMSPKQDNGPK